MIGPMPSLTLAAQKISLFEGFRPRPYLDSDDTCAPRTAANSANILRSHPSRSSNVAYPHSRETEPLNFSDRIVGNSSASLPKGSRSRFLMGPSVIYSRCVSGARNPVFFGYMPPRATIWGLRDDGSIKRLMAKRNPSAIGRRVAKGIIFPFDSQRIGVSSRDRPRFKSRELTPFFADGDPFTAIRWGKFVRATSAHVSPSVIKSRFNASASLPVGSASFPRHLFCQTSARMNLASTKIAANRKGHGSTVASSFPNCSAATRVSMLAKNRKATEPLVRQINQARVFGHKSCYHDYAETSR